MYYNNPIAMTLIKKSQVITHAKRKKNLFILDLATLGQVILVRAKKGKSNGNS